MKFSVNTDSSCVSNLAYDSDTKILRVRYVTNKEYDYLDVEPTTFDEMRKADSIGRFLNAVIKPNYPYVKVS